MHLIGFFYLSDQSGTLFTYWLMNSNMNFWVWTLQQTCELCCQSFVKSTVMSKVTIVVQLLYHKCESQNTTQYWSTLSSNNVDSTLFVATWIWTWPLTVDAMEVLILHQFLSSSWSIHLIENWSTSCYF
jgi:hypothetical protein